MRYDTDLSAMNLINVIKPGNKESSPLWIRMSGTSGGRMPPLATHIVDQDGLQCIGEWIDGMPPQ